MAKQARRAASWWKPAVNAVAGAAAVTLLRLLRLTNPDRIADFGGRVMGRVGPWLKEHRVGRANLAAAFPEKSPEEIETILAGVWDNLGRVGAEYAHLDRLWDYDWEDPKSRIEGAPGTAARFREMRDDGKPALVFAAHLGNWELPAVGATVYGTDTAILYRAPNIGDVAEAINRIRAVNMGTLIPAGPDAVLRVAAALERGAHVGMLVDQHFERGVPVTFFGRTCKANPMIARLAAHYDCPIYGARTIRLPGHRFRFELTPAMSAVRNDKGEVDVQATMQAITSVVEDWAREYPEQWLWLHRRWR